MKNRILFNNPEFSRNVWLELSMNRLILMPVILLFIFFIVFISNNQIQEQMKLLKFWSSGIFIFLICVWGTKLASETIINEINDHTWDSQKLTLLSPLAIVFGKLFGSTIYQWYGGLVCLLVFIISSMYSPNVLVSLKTAFLLIVIGLFTHSAVMSASLLSIKKNKNNTKTKSTPIFMVGLLLAFFLTSYSLGLISVVSQKINWYGVQYQVSNFLLFSLLFFLLWNFVGLLQNMKQEFRFSTGIIVWIIFLVSMNLYLYGLIPNIPQINRAESFLFAFGISLLFNLTITYIMLFIEPKYIVDFRLLLDTIKKNDWYKFQLNLPLWFVSLVFSVLSGIVFFILSLFLKSNIQGEAYSLFFPLNLLLFAFRDILLLIFFNLTPNSKRADLTAIFYLLLLYGLIPAFLMVTELQVLYPIVLPIPEANFLIGTVPILLQSIGILFFTIRKYKANFVTVI